MRQSMCTASSGLKSNSTHVRDSDALKWCKCKKTYYKTISKISALKKAVERGAWEVLVLMHVQKTLTNDPIEAKAEYWLGLWNHSIDWNPSPCINMFLVRPRIPGQCHSPHKYVNEVKFINDGTTPTMELFANVRYVSFVNLVIDSEIVPDNDPFFKSKCVTEPLRHSKTSLNIWGHSSSEPNLGQFDRFWHPVLETPFINLVNRASIRTRTQWH